MDFYDFMDDCRASNMSPDEAIEAWEEQQERAVDRWADETGYYEDPYVIAGSIQGDLIESYRRER